MESLWSTGVHHSERLHWKILQQLRNDISQNKMGKNLRISLSAVHNITKIERIWKKSLTRRPWSAGPQTSLKTDTSSLLQPQMHVQTPLCKEEPVFKPDSEGPPPSHLRWTEETWTTVGIRNPFWMSWKPNPVGWSEEPSCLLSARSSKTSICDCMGMY